MRLDVVCFWDCGAILMGYGVVVAAVQDLWGAMGVLRLRCQPYGDLWGRCSCGVGPMGIYGVLRLRRGTYGVSLWGYKSPVWG